MSDSGVHRPAIVASVLGLLGSLMWTTSTPVSAHVDYVTNGSDQYTNPIAFSLSVLGELVNALLVFAGGLTVVIVVVGYLWFRPAARDLSVFRETMDAYRDLVPWLLRLAFGLPLVGAGFKGYFFSPVVTLSLPTVVTRLFLVGIGFLLLFGLATRAVALVGLVAYLLGLAFYFPEMLLAGEYIPGFLAIALVSGGRPSADQVLKRIADAKGTLYGQIDPIHRLSSAFNRSVAPYEDYAATIIRIGLGLDFVFLGLTQKLMTPQRAIRVVLKYNLTAVIPVEPVLWVFGAGVTEIVLGMALIIGLFTRTASAVALFIFTLTLFGLPDDPVLAHVTLFGLASVLLVTGSGSLALDNRLHQRTPAVETTVADE
jgi:uncharacterized membrane protein YphA (DoxX/SURF4 family)